MLSSGCSRISFLYWRVNTLVSFVAWSSRWTGVFSTSFWSGNILAFCPRGRWAGSCGWCACFLPRYWQYGNHSQSLLCLLPPLAEEVMDGKRHLEHLNWKSPLHLCSAQVLLESLWPSEMLASCCVAGVEVLALCCRVGRAVCSNAPPAIRKMAGLSFSTPHFPHRKKHFHLLGLSCVRGGKSKCGLVGFAQNRIEMCSSRKDLLVKCITSSKAKLRDLFCKWVHIVWVAYKVGSPAQLVWC